MHTGSVFGLPTKILAIVTCLAITLMSVTGVMMWWRRRPPENPGVPRPPPAAPPDSPPVPEAISESVSGSIPKTIICVVVFLGMVFPLVGASLLLLLAGQFIARRARRKSTL
jgi:uncharacterized iron-regulated membrane protein